MGLWVWVGLGRKGVGGKGMGRGGKGRWWLDREQYCRGRPEWLGVMEGVETHATHPLLEGKENKVKDLA